MRRVNGDVKGQRGGMDAVPANVNGAPSAGRARILRAARPLFTTHGYAAASMQQIADVAGVNKATLYHHFRDKEDLFVAIMADEFARAGAGIAAALVAGGSLREQLRRVALHVFASRQSDFGRLASDLREHVSAERRAALLARSALPWQVVRPAVERAMVAGEVRPIDPDLAVRLFFGMVGSHVWGDKFGHEATASDEHVATVIADLLVDGLGTAPASASVGG